jgi:hypothetical protein
MSQIYAHQKGDRSGKKWKQIHRFLDDLSDDDGRGGHDGHGGRDDGVRGHGDDDGDDVREYLPQSRKNIHLLESSPHLKLMVKQLYRKKCEEFLHQL